MALVSQGRNARKRSVWGHSTTTAVETVYTCPANCVAEITYLHVHNSSGNTDITIQWYIAADSYTSHFIEGKNLGAGEFIAFTDIQLVLQSGDMLQVQPATAAHIDTIMTVIETFVPVG